MKKQVNKIIDDVEINMAPEIVPSEIMPSVYVCYEYKWKCNRCGKKLPNINQCDNCGSYDIIKMDKI